MLTVDVAVETDPYIATSNQTLVVAHLMNKELCQYITQYMSLAVSYCLPARLI